MDPRPSLQPADPLLRTLTARFGRRTAIQRLLLMGVISPSVLRSRLAAAQEPSAVPAPPVAEPRVDPMAGDPLYPDDPYRWLEDPEDPEVIAYLEAENAYFEAVMAPTADLQARLYDEILARVQINDISYPTEYGDYVYYSYFEGDDQFEVIARRRVDLDAGEVVLDVNEIANENTVVTGWSPSPDHRYLAYLRNDDGGISYTVHIREIATGEDLPDRIELADSVLWAADGETLIYTRLEEQTLRAFQVYAHRLGDTGPDLLLHEEPDDTFFVSVTGSRSGKFLFILADSYAVSEIRFLRDDGSFDDIQVLVDRSEGIGATVGHSGESFKLLTSWGSSDARIIEIPDATPTLDAAVELVPSRPGVSYDDYQTFERYVGLFGYEDGMRQVWVFSTADGTLTRVPFEEEVHTTNRAQSGGYETAKLRFTYTSLVTPPILYELDMDTMGLTILDQEIVEGYDPTDYVVEREWATAPDGVQVPISLLTHRRFAGGPLGLARTPRAMVIEAYGAYGISYDPYYSPVNVPLYDRGVGLAIAHIRGGSELGGAWYSDGMLLSKKNTFTDLVAVADHLIDTGRTTPSQLCAWGASAGGMLMGVVANTASDRFRAIVPGVAFLDVIRTMLDETQPLTAEEWLQWGNPHDPEVYEYMASYDPYLNVEAKPYTNLYLYTGLFDDQVPYWNAAKFTAKLRATKTDDNLLLLRTDLGSGHSGASGRYDYYQEWSVYNAFLLLALEMTETKPVVDPLADVSRRRRALRAARRPARRTTPVRVGGAR